MIGEKQEQFKERRLAMGFNNPKKDAWAKRRKEMPVRLKYKEEKTMDEEFAELAKESNEILEKIKYVGFWSRLWTWLKSIFK